ncbi:MAG TPA: tRNA dihydrouridine synthase DusB [Candidatus Limnocylindrales bacterium]|nr:tRNA dihydrouridine synthase DusB [Candidatus Limnocylindrales bacterium]
MQVGPYRLSSPVYVAPMAGVTDAPFRKLAREFGAGLACTEMISSEALVRRHPESFRLMDLRWDERPVSVQLMGGDPAVMAEAARMAEAHGADIVDINMGCPVPKVVKTSGGSSLLRDPGRAGRVAEAVVRAVRIPVTTKIRLGWDFASRNHRQIALVLQDAGVQALAVHGRTRAQRYDPWADWSAIAEVKSSVRLPVAGSGDLRTPEDAARRIRETGVDAVMLGRGILGNLWLIRRTTALLCDGESVADLDWPARVALVRRHCDLVLEYYGAERGTRLLRKFIAWGLRGFKGAPRLRQMVNTISRPEDVDAVLREALLLDPGPLGALEPLEDEPDSCQAVA